MKGRSHRLPTSEPDDWGDGSWTVDCVCGVNFDDGEEMVSCDECGIWVHTRCSRFVKGETSFACDKCKTKKSKKENEETEVAQLLVELPTKTMRMDSYSSRPSFRLWTDIPIEERVHVQGVPGGEPALFQGLSSVFSSELWKCTGYVPKKSISSTGSSLAGMKKQGLNLSQRLGRNCQEMGLSQGIPGLKQIMRIPLIEGQMFLFSLSKEVPCIPLGKFDMRSSIDGVDRECHTSPKEVKKQESKSLGSKQLQNSAKRERNQLHQHGLHSNKQRKEDIGSKDHSGKKKAKSVDREANNKRRASSVEKVHQLKHPTPATDVCQLEFCEDGGYEALNTGFQDLKNEDKQEAMLLETDFDDHHGCHDAQDNVNKPKHKIVVKTLSASISNEGDRHGAALEAHVRTEKRDHQVSRESEISPRTDTFVEAVAETHDVARISVKEEDVKPAADCLNFLKDESHYMGDLDGDSSRVAVDSQRSKPLQGELMGSVPVVPDTGMSQDVCRASPSSAQPDGKVKTEVPDDQATGEAESSTVSHRKLDLAKNLPHQFNTLGRSDGQLSEILQGHETAISSLQSGQHKSQDADAISSCDGNNITEEKLSRSDEDQLHRQESEDLAGHLTADEGFSQSRPSAQLMTGSSKMGGTNPGLPAPRVRKLVVGVGSAPVPGSTIKSSSGSIKLSISSSHKPSSSPLSSTTAKLTHFSKHRLKSHLTADGKKVDAAKYISKEESVQVLARAPIKDHTKGSTNSGPKTSHASRVTHASAPKHPLSGLKEQGFSPPLKMSLSSLDVVISSGSRDPTSLSQPEIASQNKQTASGSCQKSEKIIQSSLQPSSKVSNSNHSPSMHPPAPVSASAALSDEELALLLHQELNSSPRVPRVPRVRHAGSLPQLASSTTSSMFGKRSSMSASPSRSIGVKDQNLVLKRKNKEDLGRDGFRNTRELMDETQKMDMRPSSPNHRCQDPIVKSDDSSRKDFVNKSSIAFVSGRKTTTLTSTPVGSTCPSSYVEANDQNQSSMHSSPRDVADDDASATAGANTQTLPGLIGEIMSKGRRMSYEELCDAVFPHWHNLRKQNGERYAYSSHSQAVLDCLRNRNEWAQLVDRGPKTNLNRKRRKADNDQPVMESDSENAEGRGASKGGEGQSSESHRDDVLKGKRQTQRGRLVALRGRGRKDVRKRRKGAHLTDDDLGAFSLSSEESMFSEDECQGARSRGVGSEISSSDETC